MDEVAKDYLAGAGGRAVRAAEGLARGIGGLLERIPSAEPTNICIVKEAYYNEFTIDERKKECDRIKTKYPDRIPVICERAFGATISSIDKRKFLVPGDLTVGQFPLCDSGPDEVTSGRGPIRFRGWSTYLKPRQPCSLYTKITKMKMAFCIWFITGRTFLAKVGIARKPKSFY